MLIKVLSSTVVLAAFVFSPHALLASETGQLQQTQQAKKAQQAPTLNNTAKRFLKITDDQLKKKNEAYYFLMGMCPNQKSNPVSVGRRIVENFNAFERIEGSPCGWRQPPKLYVRGSSCRITDHECFENAITVPAQRLSDVQQHEHTIELYNEFINFRRYATVIQPDLRAPRGQHKTLTDGHLLRLIDILRYAHQQSPSEAMSALLSDTGKLRGLLAQADTVFFKTVISHLLYRNVIVLSHLKDEYNLNITRTLSAITASEASIRLAVARDFSENYHTLYKQDADSLLKLLSGTSQDPKDSKAFDSKHFPEGVETYYDQILTANDIAVIYKQLLSISPLDTEWNYKINAKLDTLKHEYTKKYVSKNEVARNAIGFGIIRSTINELHLPFLRLSRAMTDLNKKIERVTR